LVAAGRYMRRIICDTSKPDGQSGPSKIKIVLIATLVGFFISVFSAFVVDYFQKNPL